MQKGTLSAQLIQHKVLVIGMKRQEEFQRNRALESLLAEVNELLAPLETEILRHYQMPKYPVVLVVGAPRCGSTLMLQWLASTGLFAYPTNLLSRFYGAPAVGAKIQLLLTDVRYSHRDELLDLGGGITFTSDLGKTKGALAPHEFWYFWRGFVPSTDPEYLDQKTLEGVDGQRLAAELAALEGVFERPLAMKGHMFQFNIPFLASVLDKVLFLYVKRSPLHNIQSLLEARVRYYGDRRSWYSVRPKEFSTLQELDPIEQVSGQVYFTNVAIEQGLDRIDNAKSLTITYEAFCASPQGAFEQLVEMFRRQGVSLDGVYSGPTCFEPTNKVRLPPADMDAIIEAYKRFSGETLKL